MKKFFNMKLLEGGSIQDHLNEFHAMIGQLLLVGIEFEDEVIALSFLCSLPESWNNVTMAVSNSVPSSGKLVFNDVISTILSEDMRRKTSGEASSSGAALTTEDRGRQKERGNNKTRGKSKARSKSKGKGKGDCWYCGKTGHMKRDCWKKKKDEKEGNGNDNNSHEANVAGEILQDALILSTLDKNCDYWVMDSGASFHATSHREYFSEYIQGYYGQVFLGDDHPCSIVGIGKIRMKLQNGNILVLNGVRDIPDLRRNRVSSSMLDKEGFVTSFGENSWKVTKGSLILVRGKMVGTLYLLTNASHICTLDSVFAEPDAEKWYHRLGHMSEKGMKILHSRKLLPKLKEVDLGFCEDCVYGKQKRVRFLKVGKEKKNEKLELVH